MHSTTSGPPSRDAAKAAAAGADARFLAGGQSLIQAMKLRLSQSERLVDLGGIADLKAISVDGNGVTIGAMATHAAVAADRRRAGAPIPALAELAGGIGDPMVRNMGTIGGSIANADPAACYPAARARRSSATMQHRPAHDRRRRVLHRPVRDGAAAGRADHRGHASRAPQKAAYVKYKQPASRFALIGVFVAPDAPAACASPSPARRARVFRATRDRGGAREELHARGRQGREDADRPTSTATCTARPSTAPR